MTQNLATWSTRTGIYQIHEQPLLFRRIQHPIPAWAAQTSAFSSTAHLEKRSKGLHFRPKRDGNPNRGVSAMRHTGLNHSLSVSKYPLPKPVLNPDLRDKPKVDENHGLWGFFNKDRTRLSKPDHEELYGRSWRVAELRNKSWEDLHRLWWVCAKERNRIASENVERERIKARFGDQEAKFRSEAVEETQKAIKITLKERWLAWENARVAAVDDPAVDLSGDGPAYDRFQESDQLEEPEMPQIKDPRAPVIV